MFLIHRIRGSKSLLKSQWINLHRIRTLKAHKHEQNWLQTDLTWTTSRTIPSNSEISMRIRSRKKSEFRLHERNHLFDLYLIRCIVPRYMVRYLVWDRGPPKHYYIWRTVLMHMTRQNLGIRLSAFPGCAHAAEDTSHVHLLCTLAWQVHKGSNDSEGGCRVEMHCFAV